MRRSPAHQQPVRGRRGGRAPGRTDPPSCSRTEATAGPVSWTSPTASPWPSRGASPCQVSQHRLSPLMLHLCMLHFSKCILICATGRRHRHCQLHAGSLGWKMIEATWKQPPHLILQNEPCACYAVLQANWLGDSREAWQERISAAAGASSVGSLLRKHGLPQRLSEALCAELGLEARRWPSLFSAVSLCVLLGVRYWDTGGELKSQKRHSNRYLGRWAAHLRNRPCYSTCQSSLF